MPCSQPINAISIASHTTASDPRPHIVYNLSVTPCCNRPSYVVPKRYSEFVALHTTLNPPASLPPKRILTTTFVPSAWADDTLIAERKAGLERYMSDILSSSSHASSPALSEFLAPPKAGASAKKAAGDLELEDALPSTLSRKTAQALVQGLNDGEVKAESSFVAASYYPDWAVGSNPPESLDYSKFDIIFFAFATPSSSFGLSFDSGATSTLQRLVSAANSSGHGTKVVLSIGGWGGCEFFSAAMSSSGNRSTFVNACVSAVNTYGLGGIDIDWEYPDESGAGQPFSSSDSANLLSFFQSLRSALGSSKIISATSPDLPWLASNGSPLTNVSAYASPLTYVNLMNYDVFQASSTPGPNAPLNNACGNSILPQYSAQAALSQWTAAGMPASKLLLGLPLYGYVSNTGVTTLQHFARPPPGFESSPHQERMRLQTRDFGGELVGIPEGEEPGEDETTTVPEPGNHDRSFAKKRAMAAMEGNDDVEAAAAGDLSSYFGQQIPFNQILALGALQRSGSVYVQANGYTEGWDNCSDTPFLFNTSRATVVTYDDTFSLADKASLAKNNGMAGCFTWSLDQDDGYALMNVVRSSLGK